MAERLLQFAKCWWFLRSLAWEDACDIVDSRHALADSDQPIPWRITRLNVTVRPPNDTSVCTYTSRTWIVS